MASPARGKQERKEKTEKPQKHGSLAMKGYGLFDSRLEYLLPILKVAQVFQISKDYYTFLRGVLLTKTFIFQTRAAKVTAKVHHVKNVRDGAHVDLPAALLWVQLIEVLLSTALPDEW